MQDYDIAKIRAHDRDALDALFGRCMQKAFAIAFRLCSGDAEKARDLTQEALLKAVRSIDSFKGEASFSTWLYRIVYTTYLDGRKRFARWKEVFTPWRWARQRGEGDRDIPEDPPDSAAGADPLSVLQGTQLAGELEKALQALPEKQRIVFQFKVLEEMSIKEIAHVMNCAEGTVKSHLFRATRQLQTMLRDWQ